MAKTDWHIDSDPVKPEDMNQIGQEINENRQDIEKHSSDKNNPHGVTKAQIGLGNVDNVKQMPLRETRVSDINLDDYKSPGIYAIGERNENSPSNFSTLIVFTSYTDRITQMLTSANNSKIYFRFLRTNAWSKWIEMENVEGAQEKANKAKQDAINWAKSFGFGAELVEANADSVSESGLYALTGNTPDGNTSYGVHLQRTNTHAAQIVVRPTNKIYFRSKNNGKWNEWLVISTTNDLEKLAALVSKHTSDKSNPHGVTKAQVGLSNVDNVQQATKSEFKTHVADTVR
ncbi:pyocin knob domain-containing protein [Virgibacillus proomii]|uniref:pyocin knob domain-containing protein n=1 Tax=Virgibacillus proomii TaxID=84407 RepID=UPI000984C568